MAAAWPATLPQTPLQKSFSESLPDNVIRTKMGVGPTKVRRRYTSGVRPMSFNMKMTSAQVLAFETFFADDTADGALSFDFTHPRTGVTVSMRFVEPPKIAAADNDQWMLSMKVEILP